MTLPSLTQNIVDPDFWEEHRIIDENSKLSRLTNAKLSTIVNRLMKTQDPEFDINNFTFLTLDDQEMNAFYLNKEHTANGKHVIAVTAGLVKECRSEDELAAIIGHELGHYTKKEVLGGRRNTVFEERGSDIHSVQLLDEAGYDPRAMYDICSRLFKSGGRDLVESLIYAVDVHGSKETRLEDIKTALTYIKQQRGELKQSDPGNWSEFRGLFEAAATKDGYVSYFDELLETEFGTSDHSKIRFEDLCSVLSREIESGNIRNPVRFQDMTNGIMNIWQKNRSQYENHNRPLQEIQKLVENYTAYEMKKADKTTIAALPPSSTKRVKYLFDAVRSPLMGEKLEIFGDFKRIDTRLQEFMQAQDFETAHQIASKNPLKDYLPYKDFFKFSGFKFPDEKTAVGQEIPWARHQRWVEAEAVNKEDHVIADFMEMGFGFGGLGLTKTQEPYSVFADHNGIILATGDRAMQMKKEDSLTSAQKAAERLNQENNERLATHLKVLNLFADYHNGNISAEVLEEELHQGGWFKQKDLVPVDPRAIDDGSRFVSFFGDMYYALENDHNIDANWQMFVNSTGYKTFIGGNERWEKLVENYADRQALGDSGKKKGIKISLLSSLNGNDKFARELFNTYYDFCADRGYERIAMPPYSPREIKNQFYKITSNEYDSWERGDERNQQVNEAVAQQEKWFAQHQYKCRLHNIRHCPSIYTFLGERSAGVNDEAQEIFKQISADIREGNGANSEYLNAALANAGVDFPVSPEELQRVQDKLSSDGSRKYVYSSHNALQAFVNWQYLKNDQSKPFDLEDYANHTVHYVNSYAFPAAEYTEALAKFINKHKLYPTGDFDKDLRIYELMDRYGMFSPDVANKEKFLNSLVDRMPQLEPERREQLAVSLLSQKYTTLSEYGHDGYRILANIHQQSLPYATVKNKLMDIWVETVADRLGVDDGTPEYMEKAKATLEVINEKIAERTDTTSPRLRSRMPRMDKNKIFRKFSDRIVSKENLSEYIGQLSEVSVSAEDMEKSDLYGRTFEGALALLTRTPETSDDTIKFLNTKLTTKSVSDFYERIAERMDVKKDWLAKSNFNIENIEIMHDTFWNEGLEVRSVIMNKLLNRYNPDVDKQIEYVCDLHFPKNDPYRQDAELIFKTVINNFEPFERGLILAAVASADQNKDDGHQTASKSVGKGLTMFFENMGPAWVKFGQLLSYVPDLPSEIRDDLGKLKDKADIPPRWEIYRNIRQALPKDLQRQIIDVDKILGAGSFWITAKVAHKNQETGHKEDKVLSLLRPFAAEKFRSGSGVILSSVESLGNADPKYRQLYKIAEQAGVSGALESDVEYGYRQLQKARKIYSGLEVCVEDTTVKPEVADWLYYGTGKNGISYKMMDLAKGNSLMDQKHSEQDRRKMAIAYTTIELVNLLRGDVWDTDRHSGQQNFQQLENDGMKKFIVGIFDTGAQMRKAPGRTDKVMLGELLYGMVRATRTGQDMNAYMFNKIKKMDRLNRLNIDTSYIAEVQRGLTALSDIMEYQKEIKNADGKVIQERRMLSGEDMQHIASAILESGLVDKTVKRTLTAKALLNKCRPLRAGWASSLMEGLQRSGTVNPVGIIYNETPGESRGVRLMKSAEEIAEMEHQEKSGKKLGINRRNVKSHDQTDISRLGVALSSLNR